MFYIFLLVFTSPGNSREQALLTCEHIIVSVDLVQLKSFVKFMKLIWIQHLTLPVGIACKANTKSFFKRWIFYFRSHRWYTWRDHIKYQHQEAFPPPLPWNAVAEWKLLSAEQLMCSTSPQHLCLPKELEWLHCSLRLSIYQQIKLSTHRLLQDFPWSFCNYPFPVRRRKNVCFRLYWRRVSV